MKCIRCDKDDDLTNLYNCLCEKDEVSLLNILVFKIDDYNTNKSPELYKFIYKVIETIERRLSNRKMTDFYMNSFILQRNKFYELPKPIEITI